MAWIAPTTADVLNQITPAEQAVVQKIQNSTTILSTVVATTVDEFRDAIRAGGYNLASDPTTIPQGLRNDLIALARWLWFTSLPAATSLATDYRKELAHDARKKLELIRAQKWAPEDPTNETGSRTGNWNSEQKLIMRSHPIPAPAVQFPTDITGTGATDPYANPNAPLDNSGGLNSAGGAVPEATVDLAQAAVNAAVTQALFANQGFSLLSASIYAEAGAGAYVATFTLPDVGILPGSFANVNLQIDPSANPTINFTDSRTGTLLQTVTNPNPATQANWFGSFVFGQDSQWHKVEGLFQ